MIAAAMGLVALIPAAAGAAVDSVRNLSAPSVAPARTPLAVLVLVASLARITPASAVTPPPAERLKALHADTETAPSQESITYPAGQYRVEPGDSLWAIACRTIRLRTGLEPHDGAIDAYWRAIYDANRSIIGSNPDLIFPGQRLVLP